MAARVIRIWLLLALLAGCSQTQVPPDQLRVGLAQMPITLDPRFATDAASVRVQALLHRGLIRLDEHFNPIADLADRWVHPQPLVWRFHLRSGIRFSDGSTLHAADVAATLNAIRDSSLATPLKASFAEVESVQADGDYRVLIRLKRADESLLTRLNIGILPARLAGVGQQARRTIGCGAYRLQSWQGNRLTLERRDGNGSGPGSIRFIGVKDPVTRVLKLSRGELDFIQNDLPPHLLPYLRKQPQLSMQTRPSTTAFYIGLNMQDGVLKHKRVRQALALALDRKRLKRAIFADLPQLAETVLTPDHWAATDLPAIPFDPHRAEALLDAAGFPRGPDGVRLSLNYRTSTDPTRLRLTTAAAAMWERIGVRVDIESLEWGGFYARIKRGDFQLFSLAWVGIADPDIYRWILHSSMWPPKGANRGRFSDAQVDRWLEMAAAASSQAQRRSLYAKVERKMHDALVYIPLWYDPVIAVAGPRVSGFDPKPDGSLRGLMQVQLSN